MYELGIWLTVTSMSLVVIPNIVVGLDKLCSRLDELIERRSAAVSCLTSTANGTIRLRAAIISVELLIKGRLSHGLLLFVTSLKSLTKRKPPEKSQTEEIKNY